MLYKNVPVYPFTVGHYYNNELAGGATDETRTAVLLRLEAAIRFGTDAAGRVRAHARLERARSNSGILRYRGDGVVVL